MSSMGHQSKNGDEPVSCPEATELNEFQINLLAVLAEAPRSGADIRRELEHYYQDEVTHGQLYPNLDALHERGLIVRREKAIDDRTNLYEITEEGASAIITRLKWLNQKLTGVSR